jgi:predicted Zn-dependent protease
MGETEEDADRFAVQLAGAAGYDLGGAVAFVRRLLDGSGANRRAAATHPASHRRLSLLSAAIADAGRGSTRTAP